MKTCSKCSLTKPIKLFFNRKDSKDGKQSWCKVCDKIKTDSYIAKNIDAVLARKKQYNINNKKEYLIYLSKWRKENSAKCAFYTRSRYANQIKATPKWADMQKIADKYEFAAQLKYLTLGIEYHVDHIIPLNNPIVCGLHVENNIQVLRKDLNLKKRNTFNQGLF